MTLASAAEARFQASAFTSSWGEVGRVSGGEGWQRFHTSGAEFVEALSPHLGLPSAVRPPLLQGEVDYGAADSELLQQGFGA